MNWKHYTAIASGLMAANYKSDAQIIYTDIPDILNSNYLLDLNNDATVDFVFDLNAQEVQTPSSSGYIVYWEQLLSAIGNNQIAGTNAQAYALEFNDVIGQTTPWINDPGELANGWISVHCPSSACINPTIHIGGTGDWYDKLDHFMGLRLIQGSDTLYGWARLDVYAYDYDLYSYGSTCVVKDYAVQSQPNIPIKAGELACGDFHHSLSEDSATICGNNVASIFVNGPYANYQWYKDNQQIGGATSISFDVSATGNYFVVASNDFGCSDTTSMMEVTQFSNPSAPVISVSGDTLYSTLAESYQWKKSGTSLIGATNQSYVPIYNGDYKVEITDVNGCSAVSAEFVYYTCELWDLQLNPTTDQIICEGDSTLLYHYFDFVIDDHYQWFRNDTLIDGAITNIYWASQPGLYYCLKTFTWPLVMTCPTDTIEVMVLNKPVITQSGDTLISSSTQYNHWLLNGSLIPGATNQTYVPLLPGIYSVQLAGTNCIIVSDPVEITGMEYPLAGEVQIIVLPEKNIQIQFQTTDFLRGKIRIYDALGRIVAKETVQSSVIQLSLAEKSPGWYCIQIEKDNKQFVKPVFLY